MSSLSRSKDRSAFRNLTEFLMSQSLFQHDIKDLIVMRKEVDF